MNRIYQIKSIIEEACMQELINIKRKKKCRSSYEPVEKLSSLSPKKKNGNEEEQDIGEKRQESVSPYLEH